MRNLLMSGAWLLLLAVFSHAQNPTFFWDMETANATIYPPGSDNVPGYYANITRSTEYAYAGSYSLKMVSTWAEAFFDNPTNNDVWMPVTQGTVELYWRYVAPWGARMLFQITGKCDGNKAYDTNDGISLRARAGSPGVFESGMCFDNCQQGMGVQSQAVTLVDGKWYRFIVKYRTSGSPSFSLQIDDLTPVTSTATIGATACQAWHQVLIGNDLDTPDAVQYIDNFKIWNVWLGDDPNQVATPSITPYGGNFSDSVQVTLSCGTSGSVIRYTTDNSDPTSASVQYTAPIWIKNSGTVKARGFKSGMTDSPVASATFTKIVSTQTPYSGTPFAIPCKIEAEDFDLGGEGMAYHDLTTANEGGQYRTSDGVDVESIPAGGYNVGWVSAGEWTEYTVNVASAGNYNIDCRVANLSAGGSMHIEFGGVNKSGTITVPNTGSWTTYQTVTVSNVALSAGQQVMRVVFDAVSSSGSVVNLDYLIINSSTGIKSPDFLSSGVLNQVQIQPNPLTLSRRTGLTITGVARNGAVDLYALNGEPVAQKISSGAPVVLNCTDLQPGVYIVKIDSHAVQTVLLLQ